MSLRLYNTLSRQKEEFVPITENEVKMYVCGPTVYNYVTIANLFAYIYPDILHRYFVYQKYNIKHIMNLTDVDDKTIKTSQEQSLSLDEFTQTYIDAFLQDLKDLNIQSPSQLTRATEYIPEMIKIIQKLLDEKYAYIGQDHSVYFSIVKFPEYGKLAHLDTSGLKVGFRIDHQEYDKDNAADFVLWKARTPQDGDNYWPSPFGEGRPGWSIECSAMSMKNLGPTIDIHTGGVDLIFPHHENEIAQSECYSQQQFVHYWLHNEHILINGQRMGKSLHNFYNLQDVKNNKFSGRDLRYLYLGCHYRSKLNFTWDSLQAAHNVLKNIDNFVLRLRNVKIETPNIPANSYESLFVSSENQFFDAIEDDLNTPKALAVMHNLIKKINILIDDDKIGQRIAEKTIELLEKFDHILGVIFVEIQSKSTIPATIEELAKKRQQARKKKDFKKADEYRQQIENAGYAVEDKDNQYIIKKI